METIEIIKIVAAVLIAYAIIGFVMWLFRNKKEKKK